MAEIKILDYIFSLGQNEYILAFAAFHCVILISTKKSVLAFIAEKVIISDSANEQVIAFATFQRVMTSSTAQMIIAFVAMEAIVMLIAFEEVFLTRLSFEGVSFF